MGLIRIEEFFPLFFFRNMSEVLYLLILTRVPAVWSKMKKNLVLDWIDLKVLFGRND